MAGHYFESRPHARSARRTVRVRLADVQLDLITDAGVFSGRQLDPGTRVLLAHAPPPSESRTDLLDLGCGYGPIALTLASRYPSARVWAVDVNERALALVAENVAMAGLDNVRAVLPNDVPAAVRFAAIYSNPPIRVGKPALHAMLIHWLRRLDPAGQAYLVVHRHLGSDSLARWLTEHGFPTTRLSSERGHRLLEVRPRSAQWPS